MGVIAVVVNDAGREMGRLPDPAGGYFDAAGDFDRLLTQDVRLPLWSSIDRHGATTLPSSQMSAFLLEIERLEPLTDPGEELHSLNRLRVMAAVCRSGSSRCLRFVPR